MISAYLIDIQLCPAEPAGYSDRSEAHLTPVGQDQQCQHWTAVHEELVADSEPWKHNGPHVAPLHVPLDGDADPDNLGEDVEDDQDGEDGDVSAGIRRLQVNTHEAEGPDCLEGAEVATEERGPTDAAIRHQPWPRFNDDVGLPRILQLPLPEDLDPVVEDEGLCHGQPSLQHEGDRADVDANCSVVRKVHEAGLRPKLRS
mmetsp:Transcript_27828/g.60831  ORF Transcript_27828/g.60831 Transcript_27828/m.60831 type:complete len:201 (-) Transcript_27828:528-1130(-)